MKKLIFTTAIILFTMMTTQAQFFAGGSFSINASSGSTEADGTSNDKASSFSFGLNPKAGYFFSDQFMAGVGLTLSTSSTKIPGDPEVVNRSNTVGLTPFARYYAFNLSKFSLFAQGQLPFSVSNQSRKEGSTTNDGPTTTNIGLNVFPGLAYNLNETISLEAYINGFSFALNHSVEKEENGGITTKDKDTSFGLGANLNSIATTGFITIGAIIKF